MFFFLAIFNRFIAVMYDDKESIIPGNALVVDPKKQFRPLSKYGNAFLNRFQCSSVASPVLQVIIIIFFYQKILIVL